MNNLAAAAAAAVATTESAVSYSSPGCVNDSSAGSTPLDQNSAHMTSESTTASAFGSDIKACAQQTSDATKQAAAAAALSPPDLAPTDPSTTSASTGGQAVSAHSIGLESSLLLKPFSGIADNTRPDASMTTPQSIQDAGSASISPLDMLIAALEPQQQQQQPRRDLTVDMQSPSGEYAGMPWSSGTGATAAAAVAAAAASAGYTQDTLRRASDAVLLEGYQLGKPLSSNGSNSSDMMGQPESFSKAAIRKGSYPPGIKRPFSEFEHLLSAADMCETNQLDASDSGGGFNINGANVGAFSQPNNPSMPPAVKHARHDSVMESSNMTPVESSAAAVAAAAAANISYASTFPYSTRRSTAFSLPMQSESISNGSSIPQQPQYLNTCFDPLNTASNATSSGIQLNAGMVIMSGPQSAAGGNFQFSESQQPPYQHHHYRSLSLSHVDYQPTSMLHPSQHISSSINSAHALVSSIPGPLQMTSPLAPVPSSSMATAAAAAAGMANNPAMGYFYEGMPMSNAIDGSGMPPDVGNSAAMFTSAPIPAIPGVTVSPKEEPRRLSVPDMAPTDEEREMGKDAWPRRQKVRFSDDMYTPMWVRNKRQDKAGFCDTCSPGKWLQLKNSAFWYHKQFFHGISSVSGRPFVRPLQVRHFDADIIEGLCHQCNNWVPIANAKRRNSVLWFRHAHKCHVYHKPKQEDNDCNDQDIDLSLDM
ncbi:hypothetical protein GGI25_002348 [Coemansia spiralis]|uniref:Transcription regulator Rua1 C-terminal domain-containing protein n=2 Tax=Coemansia TaxID=4863 RepID=A0A9W8G924_9FUNG|nr:hypothetical protein GGI25_002348 [Coemansia spiralis]